MTRQTNIPAFGLYGDPDPFPDLIHCEDFTDRAPKHNWHILPHRHDQMSQLFVVKSGLVEIIADGERHHLESGNFIYIPRLCVHELTIKPDTFGTIFSLPQKIVTSVQPASTNLTTELTIPFAGPLHPQLATTADTLEKAVRSASPYRAQLVTGLVHAMLAFIADIGSTRDRSNSDHRPSRLLAFDHLIAEHLSEAWTISDYAKALSISSGHLSRICRAATGLGAAAYLERSIVNEACRLLAFTHLPVSAIGYRVGYADPSYFSKRFRKVQGMSPTDYRARFTKAGTDGTSLRLSVLTSPKDGAAGPVHHADPALSEGHHKGDTTDAKRF